MSLPTTATRRSHLATIALTGTLLASTMIGSMPTASAAAPASASHASGTKAPMPAPLSNIYPWNIFYSDLYNASITQTLVDSARNIYAFGSEGGRAFVRKVNPSTGAEEFVNYFGPSGSSVVAATFDPSGNIYVTGKTNNSMYVYRSFDTDFNAYVAKINPTTGDIEYAVGIYFTPIDIAADAEGNAYLLGDDAQFRGVNRFVASDGYPHGSTEAYVFKLDPDAVNINYGTYLGGTKTEIGKALALVNNELYVAGVTKSDDFPIRRVDSSDAWGYGGSQDGFLTSLDTSTGDIIWSTYIGGSNYDAIQDIAYLDGKLYIAGNSDDGLYNSYTFGYQPTYTGGDSTGFVMAMDTNTHQFFFNGFLNLNIGGVYGSLNYPTATNMKLAPQWNGTVFVTGRVDSSNLFANQTSGIFVSKVLPLANTVSRPYPFANSSGTGDKPTSLFADSNSNLYISGSVANASLAGVDYGSWYCGTYCPTSSSFKINSYVMKMDGNIIQ